MGTESGHRVVEVCDTHLARAFKFLGKRWTGIVLGTLTHGPAGFAELARAIPGISESVLSDRLVELAAAGLITRDVRQGPPISVVYELTRGGRALSHPLNELALWAAEHLPEPCTEKAAGQAMP